MAAYNNKDPNTTDMLLKRRKLTAPKLFVDETEETEELDTASQLLKASSTGYKDYNTGDVSASDIYPGSALSPVRIENSSGPYGAIPVVSGGQILYPTALSHKRAAVKMEQDALEQEREAKVKDLFGMHLAAPAMAPALQKFYFDEVNKRLNDVYSTLGREKATAALGDVTNPITQNVLKPYAEYRDAVRASLNVQDAMKTVINEVNKGERVMSNATKEELKQIQDGTWLKQNNPDGTPRTIKDYAKIPARFNTYATLDTKFKELKDAGLLEQDVTEVIERGVTVDGKKINSLNGAQLLDQVTTKVVSSPRIQALKQSILNDPELTDLREEDVDARLNSLARSTAHQITSISPRSSGGLTDHDKKKIDYQIALNKRYSDITTNLIEGDSESLGNVAKGKEYKDGIITNVKIVPKGTKVKGQGADKDKVGLTTKDKLLIEYSVEQLGEQIPKQEEVTGKEEIIKVSNDWYNYKKEGTGGYIDREDMSELFKSDTRFQDTGQQKQKTVVRTGTLNGKKVIQYSDGSVEYAD